MQKAERQTANLEAAVAALQSRLNDESASLTSTQQVRRFPSLSFDGAASEPPRRRSPAFSVRSLCSVCAALFCVRLRSQISLAATEPHNIDGIGCTKATAPRGCVIPDQCNAPCLARQLAQPLTRWPPAQAEQAKAKQVAELRSERGALSDKVAALEGEVRALHADKASQRTQLEQCRVRPPPPGRTGR